ncbi:acyl-CoA reductase-like NAD-dependent aldehyde dehydrogenase [Actinoalloteichus hoggarensis]|uniref:NAD/NADP-dependent betaine aldehyde dehydrogenase n=1 Tax=Actinoalloteichus hoggarensis TaxID=1470176 RepID=A0A221W946_9PSEU|nr:aldehyde dehydrogenase family protein [Actinoalloteichus hoggarensis]ASO21887.1 NAD/NADP-dependent betaine aldehyde dehydrogenase [Actinoalloteichus hoggarensis]MBB5922484.1 acyl-CoA reductase-like NAD-dependent aldehyde dehydrogenase [Actinoalloteichus hoggarensis]
MLDGLSGSLITTTRPVLLEQAAREHLRVHSPVDGALVGLLPVADEHEITQALRTARSALSGWSRTSAAERGRRLRIAASAVRASVDELAALHHAETGRSFADARAGVLAGADVLEQYAELGPVHRGRSLLGRHCAVDLTVPQPRGVVVVLTSWNDPVGVSCGLLGAALVTGNAVVYKPSERAPHVGRYLTETLSSVLPSGVLAMISGDGRTGARLAADPGVDLIAHLGCSEAGRSIAESAARTGAAVLLENGGNDALIVDAGVDVDWAAEQAAVGAFSETGQRRGSIERIYVHRTLADRFAHRLAAQAARRVARPALPGDVELGPLVDRRRRDQVHEQVGEAIGRGAWALAGGRVPRGPGAFYPATVLTGCVPDMRVMREETFGPVAAIRVVEDFDQALAEAGEDRYGRAATVLTASMSRAQRAWQDLPVGTVRVNSVVGAVGRGARDRGGVDTGFDFGPELLDEMTAVKVVHLGLAVPGGRRSRGPDRVYVGEEEVDA